MPRLGAMILSASLMFTRRYACHDVIEAALLRFLHATILRHYRLVFATPPYFITPCRHSLSDTTPTFTMPPAMPSPSRYAAADAALFAIALITGRVPILLMLISCRDDAASITPRLSFPSRHFPSCCYFRYADADYAMMFSFCRACRHTLLFTLYYAVFRHAYAMMLPRFQLAAAPCYYDTMPWRFTLRCQRCHASDMLIFMLPRRYACYACFCHDALLLLRHIDAFRYYAAATPLLTFFDVAVTTVVVEVSVVAHVSTRYTLRRR